MIKTAYDRFLQALMLLWVATLLFALGSCMARAECLREVRYWHHGNCNVSEGFFSSCRRGHWRYRCVERGRDYDRGEPEYRRRDPRPERVFSYERRADQEIAERGACKAERLTAVSDEHKDVDRARTDAIEKWRKMVSWSGGGGEFMDYSLAVEREFRCGPSSPGDSWAAKGGKLAAKAYGAVTGQSGPGGPINADGMSQRCQIWARPCRARREIDDTGQPQ